MARPRPVRRIVSGFGRAHRAALAALRANSVVPTLVRRFSLERLEANEDDIRRLRAWPAALKADPGWAVIASSIDNATDWPAVWDDAIAAGFSPKSDHHHALLFAAIAQRTAAEDDFEVARWAFDQSVIAWSRVFGTEYPALLFDALAPKLSSDGPDREELLRCLLEEIVANLHAPLQDAAAMRTANAGDVERRRLQYLWGCLRTLHCLPTDNDPHRTIATIATAAADEQLALSNEVLQRFSERVEALDLSADSGDALTGPYRWVSSVFAATEYSEAAVTQVVTSVVETCWGLRRMGRDEIPEFHLLLDLGTPFNEDLRDRLLRMDSAFGHNGKCADFLVFLGERHSTSQERRAIYRSGLEVCPGHRNSAMLLSYELLADARKLLNQTSVAPGIVGRLPAAADKIRGTLLQAHAIVEEANEIYPYNEQLPQIRESLRKDAERLNVELPDS